MDDDKYRRAFMRAAAANINNTTIKRKRSSGFTLFWAVLLSGMIVIAVSEWVAS